MKPFAIHDLSTRQRDAITLYNHFLSGFAFAGFYSNEAKTLAAEALEGQIPFVESYIKEAMISVIKMLRKEDAGS